jgi:phenylacetate-CoA ligase
MRLLESPTTGLSASPWLSGRGAFRRTLREGRSFRRVLTEMQARERWTVEQMAAYQEQRLRELLITCSRHVPYYMDLFRSERLDLDRSTPREVLSRIPLLEKSELRRDPERFRNRSTHRWRLREAHSSGTTGTPITFWRDLNSITFENAMIWRQRRWAGIGFDDRRVSLRGELPVPASRTSPPFWRYDAAQRELLMSSYHLSPQSAPDYAAALAAYAPQVVEGYPSSVALVARLLREAGTNSLPIKAVITSAEMLLDSQREVIEEVFQATIYDHYGNSERTTKIFTCERGSDHVQPDYAIVEFTSDGEIVGTPLFNLAFPLLRYRSGDTATAGGGGGVGGDDCPCGRPAFPIVKEIQGRRESYVVTPEGRQIGRLDHIYKGVEHVVEGQIVQQSVGRIVLKIVRDSGYQAKDEDLLLRHAMERLGPSVEVAVEYVENIPRTASGKFVGVVGLDSGRA